MKMRGLTTWFAVDSMIHLNPQVLDLSTRLGIDVDTTVGKLARLWSWAKLAQVETGELGMLPDTELAAILRWKKKPALLTEALLASGVLSRKENGVLYLTDWYEMNGKSTERARKDRERKRFISVDTVTVTETKTETDTLTRTGKESKRKESEGPAVEKPALFRFALTPGSGPAPCRASADGFRPPRRCRRTSG